MALLQESKFIGMSFLYAFCDIFNEWLKLYWQSKHDTHINDVCADLKYNAKNFTNGNKHIP